MLETDGNFYGNTNGNSNGGSVFYRLSMGFNPLVNLVTWSSKVGQTVEILGQGFTGTTQVLFGSTPATFNNNSDTYMTATVPSGATTGPVRVTTFISTLKSNRSFLVTPQITSFTPTSVKVGTVGTLTGVSLSQTSKVNHRRQERCVHHKIRHPGNRHRARWCQDRSKDHPHDCGGSCQQCGKFYVWQVLVLPSVTNFTPTSGPVGTSVAIKGNTFTGTTSVTFGGIAATSYQVISDTEVDALVPTGAITGTIAVTTSGGTATSASKFTVTP